MLISKTPKASRVRNSSGLQPVPFVVGVGRSGTTLLRLMLDAHPDLAVPPETAFIPQLARRRWSVPEARDKFVRALAAHHNWPDFHLDQGELRSRLDAVPTFTLGDGLRVFYQVYADKFGKPRWGDKTPSYADSMRLIQRHLPEARFIHLIRDGRDVALSVKDLWFGPNTFADAAAWWASRIDLAREQATDVRYYLELRYEDLVTDSEGTLRKVCEFVELPWDSRMLEYYKRSEERLAELQRPVRAPTESGMIQGEDRTKIHTLTKEPPRAERIGRWKASMSDADRQRFEAIAGATLQEFGYPIGDEVRDQEPVGAV